MRTIKNLLFLFVTLFFVANLEAQDKIVLKSGEIYQGYILEKTNKQISFRISETEPGPLFVMKARKIKSITLRDGQEISIPQQTRMNKRLGVGLGIIPGYNEEYLSKLYLDYFVAPGLCIESGALIKFSDPTGMFLGAKYYIRPYDPGKIKVYAGLSGGYIEKELLCMAPIGLSYVCKNGLDVKLGLIGLVNATEYTGLEVCAEAAIGWRF